MPRWQALSLTDSFEEILTGVKAHKNNDKLHGQLRGVAVKNDAAIVKLRKCLLQPKQLSVTSNSGDNNNSMPWIQQYVALITKVRCFISLS